MFRNLNSLRTLLTRSKVAHHPARLALLAWFTRVIALLPLTLLLLPTSYTPRARSLAAAEPLVGPATSPPAGRSAASLAAVADELLTRELAPADQPNHVKRCDDEVFIRRVSLDLIGYPASPEQVTAFALDPDPLKRFHLVNRLMNDPRFGENWGRYWRDVILYRRTDERALLGSEACQEFLTTQINQNKPWDEVATAFITAQGDVREQGATALIFAQSGEPEGVVAEISRIFNGIQIQCAQCHDHPTDRWKREQFHQLAAFLPRVALRPDMGGNRRTFHVAVTDTEPRFRPRMPNQRIFGTLEHYMPDLKDPSARGTLTTPIFFATGQSLPLGTADAERRESLARWVTSSSNPWFAKALVNRLWGELVGEGFYEPLDDIGPDRQATAPQTLDHLAASFTASGYDVKQLLRVIMATAAYQRDSRDRREPDATPFAANVPQRLRADQLLNQLVVLLGLPDSPTGTAAAPPNAPAFRRTIRQQFNQMFGFDPSEPREEVKSSIPQTLILMNSPGIQGAISARAGMLGSLLRQLPADEPVVVELYLRALNRQPSPREIQIALSYIQETGNRGEAFEDLLWSLINSTEFLHRR